MQHCTQQSSRQCRIVPSRVAENAALYSAEQQTMQDCIQQSSRQCRIVCSRVADNAGLYPSEQQTMQDFIQQSSRQCSGCTYRRGCCDYPDRLERLAELYRSLCRTTCCEKGFRPLNPLAFTHFPSVVTAAKRNVRTG